MKQSDISIWWYSSLFKLRQLYYCGYFIENAVIIISEPEAFSALWLSNVFLYFSTLNITVSYFQHRS